MLELCTQNFFHGLRQCFVFRAHVEKKFLTFGNKPPQPSHCMDQLALLKVPYPVKRPEAAWMMAPLRTLLGLKRAVTLGRSGFPFTPRPLFRHKSSRCVSRRWKTRSCDLQASQETHFSFKSENKPPTVAEVQNKDSQIESRHFLLDVKTPSFTVRMKQIGNFYARPPCTLEDRFQETGIKIPPPLEEVLWAWSMVLMFSPVRSSLQKNPHTLGQEMFWK